MGVIVFGVGGGYKDLMEKCESIEIVAAADNKCELGSVEIVKFGNREVKLIHPNDIRSYLFDKIIISTNRYRFKILQQLLSLGVSVEKIEFYCPSWSQFRTIDVCKQSESIFLKVKQKDGISYFWHNEVDEHIAMYPITYGEYAYRSSHAHQVVVDVGMNIGISTLWFANRDGVDEVYGYEPFEEIYSYAINNLKENPKLINKIKMYNYGLWNEDKYVEGNFCVDHSTASRVVEEENNEYSSVKVKVKVKDAGNEFEQILKNDNRQYILKLNCEGAEYEIVESLINRDLLKRFDICLIETHDGREREMFQYLERSGFVYFYKDKTDGYGFIRAVMPRKMH